jgi:hypothetical protein
MFKEKDRKIIAPELSRVYICYPFAGKGTPENNIISVRQICREILNDTVRMLAEFKKKPELICETRDLQLYVPVATQLLFPRFMEDAHEEREMAMLFCLSVLDSCNELWVCSDTLTAGMKEELYYTVEREIPVKYLGERFKKFEDFESEGV